MRRGVRDPRAVTLSFFTMEQDEAIAWRNDATDALLRQHVLSQDENVLMPWLVPLPTLPLSLPPPPVLEPVVLPPPSHPPPRDTKRSARRRRRESRFSLSNLTGEHEVQPQVGDELDNMPTETLNMDWEYVALRKHYELFLELRYKEWRRALTTYLDAAETNRSAVMVARLLRLARRSESRYLLHEAMYINLMCTAHGMLNERGDNVIPWSDPPLQWDDLKTTQEATPKRAAKIRRVLLHERKALSLMGERGVPCPLGNWECS